MKATNEQEIIEFFEKHPGAELLAAGDISEQVRATGLPVRTSPLLADGSLYAVDVKGLSNMRMAPPEIRWDT